MTTFFSEVLKAQIAKEGYTHIKPSKRQPQESEKVHNNVITAFTARSKYSGERVEMRLTKQLNNKYFHKLERLCKANTPLCDEDHSYWALVAELDATITEEEAQALKPRTYKSNFKTRGITRYGLKFWNKYKNKFGTVTKAIMRDYSDLKTAYPLTLFNSRGDKMYISGVAAGYSGEGSRGAIIILRNAGFRFDDDIIYDNYSFQLEKNHNSNMDTFTSLVESEHGQSMRQLRAKKRKAQ